MQVFRTGMALVAAAIVLAACSGGAGSSSPPPRDLPTSTSDAPRFLNQATLGVTDAEVTRVPAIGYSAWIDHDLPCSVSQYGLPDGRGGFTSPNRIGNGSLLPETSVDQYGATLGGWFGLTDSQLLDAFPNLSQFDASRRNVGFMLA